MTLRYIYEKVNDLTTQTVATRQGFYNHFTTGNFIRKNSPCLIVENLTIKTYQILCINILVSDERFCTTVESLLHAESDSVIANTQNLEFWWICGHTFRRRFENGV